MIDYLIIIGVALFLGTLGSVGSFILIRFLNRKKQRKAEIIAAEDAEMNEKYKQARIKFMRGPVINVSNQPCFPNYGEAEFEEDQRAIGWRRENGMLVWTIPAGAPEPDFFVVQEMMAFFFPKPPGKLHAK